MRSTEDREIWKTLKEKHTKEERKIKKGKLEGRNNDIYEGKKFDKWEQDISWKLHIFTLRKQCNISVFLRNTILLLLLKSNIK